MIAAAWKPIAHKVSAPQSWRCQLLGKALEQRFSEAKTSPLGKTPKSP